MAKPAAAVVASTVALVALAACGARSQQQGAGSLGVVSGAPSRTPSQSRPPSPSGGGPTLVPSHGGGGNGGGGHGGTPPKPRPDPNPQPDPDPRPNPDPVQPPVDYAIGIGAVISIIAGPECSWTTVGGSSVYEFHVVGTYSGPAPAPTMTVTITDGIGNVLVPIDAAGDPFTGKVALDGSLTDIIVRDNVAHPDVYSEVIKVSLDGVPATDPDPRNNTAEIDMANIPLKNPPAGFQPGHFMTMRCSVPVASF